MPVPTAPLSKKASAPTWAPSAVWPNWASLWFKSVAGSHAIDLNHNEAQFGQTAEGAHVGAEAPLSKKASAPTWAPSAVWPNWTALWLKSKACEAATAS